MPRRTTPSLLSVLGFALTLLFAPHCTTERAATGEDEATAKEEGVVVSAASFTLAWDTEGLELDPDGGFSVTTNLGYRVRIDRGFHVSHGVSLAPCATNEVAAASVFGLAIRSAHAHTEDEDPSAMEPLVISDLARPGVMELGASAFTPARYCGVFWLLARGMPGAVTGDGLDMSNRSVFFSGAWQRGDASGPVDIDTWWPQGKLEDLAAVTDPAAFDAASTDGAVRFAFVTIRSPLGRAFDGVEFAADAEAVIEDRIVDNLTAGAEFVVALGEP
jgi:hypothetical protein